MDIAKMGVHPNGVGLRLKGPDGSASFEYEQLLQAHSSFCCPVFDSADFPLYPVWLAALFALGSPKHGPRLAGASDLRADGRAARSTQDFVEAEGPGFSGMLAFPQYKGLPGDYMEIPKVVTTVPDAPPVTKSRRDRNLLRLGRFWPPATHAVRRTAIAAVLLGLVLFGASKMGLQSPSTSWASLAATIQDRAKIDLEEDFATGLGAWTGVDNTWSTDHMGSAQPGRLALYQPSIALSDYRLEFQGQIESKAMGFVFRAADPKNYYATKILIVKPGPEPSVAMVRYAVIHGQEGPKTQIALPMRFRSDMIYKLLVTVQGEHFTVLINGQLADAWSDDRLKSGGVGFFAEKGEISHLRSIHVVDKEDLLGNLCYQVSQWTADRRTLGAKHE